MASKPPDALRQTGNTKRFKENLTLVQHVLRAQDALNKAAAALTAVFQILSDQQAEDDHAPPSPPPSMRPTRLEVPAMSQITFAAHVRKTWASAKTTDQKEKVRESVRRGRETGLIDEVTEASLLDEFKIEGVA